MHRSFSAKLMSVMLVVVFPASVFGADSRAMLSPQGSVSVNGNALARSTALFAGDRVTTTDKSSGTITVSGSTIQLGPQTSAVYSGKALQVASGAASVVTSSGIEGKVANLTVAPAEGKAKYSFGVRGKKAIIAALEGRLRVGDGSHQMMLEPGKAIAIPAEPAPRSAAGDAPDPAGGGGGGFNVGNGLAIGIAAATIALSVTLGFVTAEEATPTPASPQ